MIKNLVAVAVLSGIAGLGYQVVWSEQLALLLGSTQTAVAAVLAAFMLGLTLGSAVIARFCGSLRQPLWWYAGAEVVIAVTAHVMRPAKGWVEAALAPLLGSALDGTAVMPLAGTGLVLSGAITLMLLPTVAMGATLPLLVEAANAAERSSGRNASALYAANTIGAALGAFGSAMFLLPAVGLGTAITLLSLLNVAAAVWAGALSRPITPAATMVTRTPRLASLPLIMVAITGVVSFSYEILWTRLLVQHLGADVYAFGMMLTVLLVGIALGAWLIRAASPAHPGRLFAWSQLALAAAGLVSYELLSIVPSPALTQDSFWALTGLRLGYVAVLLMPPAILIGVSLPLAIFWLNQQLTGDVGGRGVGIAYACNTLGAIIGALGAGLWLLPTLGFAASAGICVSANLLVGVYCWWQARGPGQWAAGGVSALVAATLLLAWPEPPEALFRSSPLNDQVAVGDLRLAVVGRTSTVTLIDQPSGFRLLTNGLPESLIQRPGEDPGQMDVSHWLSLLPVTMRPDATRMLVIGLGGGGTVEDLPTTLERIDVVELEPRVLEANQRVASLRRSDPLADPRVHVHINDARMELKRSRQLFDVIVSQPSHPWTSGAAHLYTKEFFELVRARLVPDGVFSQWIGLQFVDEDLIRSLIATLGSVFEHVQVFSPPQQGAMLLIASNEPLPNNLSPGRARFEQEWIALGVNHGEYLMAARYLHDSGLRAISDGAPVISDYHNRLKYSAPRILGRPAGKAGLDSLAAPHDSLHRLDAEVPTALPGRVLEELLRAPGNRAQLYAAGSDARESIVNTWRYRGDEQPVNLAPALQDGRLTELARATLFNRFRENLLAGQPLVRVRQWLRPDVEQRLLNLLLAVQSGQAAVVREQRPWLRERLGRGSPYWRMSVQLQAEAALRLDDEAWAANLLTTAGATLVEFPRVRLNLALLAGDIDTALGALRMWQQSIARMVPGVPFRSAVDRLGEYAAAEGDPRYQMALRFIELRTRQGQARAAG